MGKRRGTDSTSNPSETNPAAPHIQKDFHRARPGGITTGQLPHHQSSASRSPPGLTGWKQRLPGPHRCWSPGIKPPINQSRRQAHSKRFPPGSPRRDHNWPATTPPKQRIPLSARLDRVEATTHQPHHCWSPRGKPSGNNSRRKAPRNRFHEQPPGKPIQPPSTFKKISAGLAPAGSQLASDPISQTMRPAATA